MNYKATLANLGNTCYLNSTIQALCRSKYIFNKQSEDSSDNFINEWSNLIKLFNNDSVISPRRFLQYSLSNATSNGYKELGFLKQNDAHECLLYWLGLSSSFEPLFKIKSKTIVNCSDCNKKHIKEEDNLILEINPVWGTLIDALINYFKEEKLDDYVCDECKNKNVFIKNVLGDFPTIFAISLKKYHIIGRSNLKYPDHFIMNGIKYSLVSIICHEGDMGGGHYYTIARNSNSSEWNIYNDTRRIPTKEYIVNSAYILLYDRI